MFASYLVLANIVTSQAFTGRVKRVTTSKQETTNTDRAGTATNDHEVIFRKRFVDRPPSRACTNTSRTVSEVGSGVYQTEINRHPILNVVRARPDSVTTAADSELALLSLVGILESDDRLGDLGSVLRLDQAPGT